MILVAALHRDISRGTYLSAEWESTDNPIPVTRDRQYRHGDSNPGRGSGVERNLALGGGAEPDDGGESCHPSYPDACLDPDDLAALLEPFAEPR
jgi:hypothetical protein